MKLRFLGTGTSVGVPQIGCTCATCTSKDPRDRRRRTGCYVTAGDVAFVIDTPPEFREACLQYGVSKVDAVLISHCHMDHVAGFDDVRRFNTINGTKVACDPNSPGANGRTWKIIGKPMNCYAAAETIADMQHVFPYISTKPNAKGLFRPLIQFKAVQRPFRIGSVKVTPLDVPHGPKTFGFLLEEDGGGRIGWVSDCSALPPKVLGKLRGVDAMVLNCLRERPHPTHLNLAQSLAYAKAIGAKKTWLIHMCHDVKHAEFERLLPRGVRLAYDGLTISV